MTLVLNYDLRELEACSVRKAGSDGDGLELYLDCGEYMRSLIVYVDDDGNLVVDGDIMENPSMAWFHDCVDDCKARHPDWSTRDCEEVCGA